MRDKAGDYLSPFLLSFTLTVMSFLLILKFIRGSYGTNHSVMDAVVAVKEGPVGPQSENDGNY